VQRLHVGCSALANADDASGAIDSATM